MKTSVIRQRVADFLKSHAPFDNIAEQDLLDLAGSGRVKFHESEEYIFRQGDSKGQFVWMIQQGRVELLEGDESGERLRDVAGEGDLLGLDRFDGDGSCLYSARTATDVILYGVAAPLFEALVPRYPLVERFLTAHFSVSTALGFGRTSWLDAEGPSLEFLSARLVTVAAQAAMTDVAGRLMESTNEAVALVDGEDRLVGIVTPLDLCHATIGSGALHRPTTIAAPVTTRSAVRGMLQSKVEALAVTSDGTAAGRLEGILTAPELALFCGENPPNLVRSIDATGSAVEIVPFLRTARRVVVEGLAQPRDVDDCSMIGTEVTIAASSSCVRQANRKVSATGIRHSTAPSSWVLFGSAARGDLLEPILPAIAAVYDDSAEGLAAHDAIYFAALSGETMTRLHDSGLSAAGFFWPEGSHPAMPLSEWKRLFRDTIRDPIRNDLYARREFFDLRHFSGDQALVENLRAAILRELREHETAIPLLANDTLGHLPPLTFFKGLVLELDGAQRDSFDIARTAVSPITDAARVFALAKRRLVPAGTLQRLAAACEDFPDGATILGEASEAFRIALYYQTLSGTPRIDPAKLGKFDQRLLKTAFSSIQRLLEFTASTFISA